MIVAGIDEAGRGALAGPVVAGAVVFGGDFLEKIKDSKQLSDAERRECAEWIMEHAAWGVGVVEASEIDEIGIKPATEKAMNLALKQLQKDTKPDQLQVDGRDGFRFPVPSEDIVKGDEKVPAISAASILAKVHRDDLMIALDIQSPGFGFASNKGYGAQEHYDLLSQGKYGPAHRQTYDPLKTWLNQGQFAF